MILVSKIHAGRLTAISCALMEAWPFYATRRVRGAVLGLLLCAPLFGIDRDLRIDQLHHTSWTRKDGVPSRILALAQTTDGFLWIDSSDGLYRFDGIHFEPYQSPDGKILPNNADVNCLLAMPDGGLWIGLSRGPTSFLKDGKITTYPEPAGAPGNFAGDLARDDQGIIWRADDHSGLSRFTGSRWERSARRGDSPAALTTCMWTVQGPSGWTPFTD